MDNTHFFGLLDLFKDLPKKKKTVIIFKKFIKYFINTDDLIILFHWINGTMFKIN